MAYSPQVPSTPRAGPSLSSPLLYSLSSIFYIKEEDFDNNGRIVGLFLLVVFLVVVAGRPPSRQEEGTRREKAPSHRRGSLLGEDDDDGDEDEDEDEDDDIHHRGRDVDAAACPLRLERAPRPLSLRASRRRRRRRSRPTTVRLDVAGEDGEALSRPPVQGIRPRRLESRARPREGGTTMADRGGGVRCCGNLGCPGSSKSGVLGDAVAVAEEEARYYAAARRHVGIGVPENGGRIPMGMILPKPPPSSSSSSATTEDDAIEDDPLERYLRSCGEGLGLGGGDDDDDDGERRRRRRRRRDDNEGDDDDGGRRRRRNSRDERRQRSKRERGSSRLRRSSSSRGERCDSAGGGGDDDDIVREREEMERLTDVPHGIGLHDYEVDFAYVEGNARKRELVKVRLCLRCAPLLFVARRTRRGDDGDEKDEEGGRRRAGAKVGGGVVAPAMKARAAREEAAARSRSLTQNGG